MSYSTKTYLKYIEKTAVPPALTNLHRQLIVLLLHNPFEDNLHLLHSMGKQNPNLTLEDLKRLKQECDLDTCEAVCSILLRKLFSGCGGCLNTLQLNFVRQTCPELFHQ